MSLDGDKVAYVHKVSYNKYGYFCHVSDDFSSMTPEEHLSIINGPMAAMQSKLGKELKN